MQNMVELSRKMMAQKAFFKAKLPVLALLNVLLHIKP